MWWLVWALPTCEWGLSTQNTQHTHIHMYVCAVTIITHLHGYIYEHDPNNGVQEMDKAKVNCKQIPFWRLSEQHGQYMSCFPLPYGITDAQCTSATSRGTSQIHPRGVNGVTLAKGGILLLTYIHTHNTHNIHTKYTYVYTQ